MMPLFAWNATSFTLLSGTQQAVTGIDPVNGIAVALNYIDNRRNRL